LEANLNGDFEVLNKRQKLIVCLLFRTSKFERFRSLF